MITREYLELWKRGLPKPKLQSPEEHMISKSIETIERMAEVLKFYGTKSEPDYAGVNPDGSPICVMQCPYDHGKKAKEILKEFDPKSSQSEKGRGE